MTNNDIPPLTRRRSATAALDKVLDGVVWLCRLIAGVLMVALIGISGWLVFGRYVLNDTPTWVEQASLVIIVYITFLGAAIGVRENSHLGIDFIREALPAAPRAVLRVASDLVLLVFGAFMAWQGWGLVAGNTERAIPLIGLSESWRAAPLLICGLLMMVFVMANLIRTALGINVAGER
ncbi:TRAP transporter small permease [Arhodomonas sp. AD133]|uniref:TRAP transporter small permease n=1 Tax=Arhodomonas sp. AD133 TaxID=3415009 RepID=UPI003EBDEB04